MPATLRRLTLGCPLVIVLGAALLLGVEGGSAATSQDPIDVLVFTKTEGFRHPSIAEGIQAITDLGAAGGWQVDQTEDAGAFTSENLAGYDVVVWLSTTGDVLNDPQQAAFEAYIRGGGGFAGIHAATDTEYDWPWYGELVGAYFDRHPPGTAQATVEVEDRTHASTLHLGDSWVRTDEWYDFQQNPRDAVHVLATLDEDTYEGGMMGEDHPIAWCQVYDGGRSWYTAGGHTPASFQEPDFRAHLAGGIRYAAGVAGACGDDPGPSPDPTPTGPEPADPGEVQRIAGPDRVATALAISEAGWDSSEYVVLASGGSFADALAAAPLAGGLDAPLLLTVGESLDPRVVAELERLDATDVVVMGGPAAISEAVSDGLGRLGLSVERVAGRDRIETAEAVASTLGDARGGIAVVAAADRFPDALAVGPVAAAEGHPIFLAGPDGLTSTTLATMRDGAVDDVLIVGGSSAVPDAVEGQLSAAGITTVTRIAGLSRYETGVAVLDFAVERGLPADELLVATGANFPDALAAGAFGARTGRLIMLVDGDQPVSDQPAAGFLAGADVSDFVLLGGLGVLPESLAEELREGP
ncbi:ThuA domain-containing protein [Euzebya tangerina]|uniref:ThuA domain-containing protein n=1 Tax=Euzebya tangerina TaxID=591198 RepID=UPI0013C305D8|nr:ThuA domain-containing protein [Euzebya tangerina]